MRDTPALYLMLGFMIGQLLYIGLTLSNILETLKGT